MQDIIQPNADKTIQGLKKLTLQNDISFSELANYFFDLAETPKFSKRGMIFHKNHKFFKTLLSPLTDYLTDYFEKKIIVNKIYLIKINNHDFFHGTAEISNGMTSPFYYFHDALVGLAMVSTNTNTEFFRITATVVPLRQVPAHLINKTAH